MALITKSGVRSIALLTVAACIGLFAIYEFSPGGIQRRNLRRAKKHIARYAGALTAQPRFQEVSFVAGSMDDGCIKVSGAVCDDSDLVDLRRLWEETSPPVITRYFVTPIGTEKTEPNKRPEGTEGKCPPFKHSQPPSVPHP